VREVREGRGWIFKINSPCVSQGFLLKLSMCVPQKFPNSTTLLPHMLFSKVVLLFMYAGRSKEEANPSPSSNRNFYIDEPQKFQNFVFLVNRSIKMTHCHTHRKKVQLGRYLHLSDTKINQ